MSPKFWTRSFGNSTKFAAGIVPVILKTLLPMSLSCNIVRCQVSVSTIQTTLNLVMRVYGAWAKQFSIFINMRKNLNSNSNHSKRELFSSVWLLPYLRSRNLLYTFTTRNRYTATALTKIRNERKRIAPRLKQRPLVYWRASSSLSRIPWKRWRTGAAKLRKPCCNYSISQGEKINIKSSETRFFNARGSN